MTTGSALSAQVLTSPDELEDWAGAWDGLASSTPTPFLSAAWVRSWWEATADRPLRCLLLTDPAGTLRAGALFSPRGVRGLTGAADVHSGDWGVVAADEPTREAAWQELARLARPVGRMALPALDPSALQSAERALGPAGYRLVASGRLGSPFLPLPGSYEELLAGVSRNLRSQVGRAGRAMERSGDVRLRTTTSLGDLDRDLEALLQLESAGWKGRGGTAVLSHRRTAQLYRTFARRAAQSGSLRLLLLELDGALVAGDLSCTVADRTSLLKTTFDEDQAQLRPGLVLRAAALRSAIEEGSTGYDSLGAPDHYKTRWGGELRWRTSVVAVRGPWRVEAVARERVQPRLGRVRRRILAARELVSRGPSTAAPG